MKAKRASEAEEEISPYAPSVSIVFLLSITELIINVFPNLSNGIDIQITTKGGM